MPDMNAFDTVENDIEANQIQNIELEERVSQLEIELSELKLAFNALMKELNG
jgi:hypothetical protein